MHRTYRTLIRFGLAVLLLQGAFALAATQVVATRVWPSPDYSRITVETREPLTFKYFELKNPERFVLDIENVEPEALQSLNTSLSAEDRYIKGFRIARNRPGVTRVVAELRGATSPQVFTLKPMSDYGHRLVLDFFPKGLTEVSLNPEAGTPARAPADILAGRSTDAAAKPVTPPKAAAPETKTATADPAPAQKGSKPATQEYIRLITVAIDAGHGGEDPGAIGAKGSKEKDITLAVAKRLKAMIDRQPNMRAVLTRDGDYFIPLHERVNKARRLQADLFVSIHADAFMKSTARGSSVFALSEKGATSAAAKWLARRENQADLIGGVNIDVQDVYLKQTLIDLTQTATIADSLRLGKAVLQELGEINDLHKAQVEQAGFAVLKAPDIPSILVETAFISNPEEESRLNDDSYQDKLADAIVSGVRRYFERNPPIARNKVAEVQSF